MLRFHAAARATLSPRVADPASTGSWSRGDGRIRASWRSPPGHGDRLTVNAGVYALDRAVVAGIPTGRAVSIERETFPGLLRDGVPFFGWISPSYWLDIGSPAKYRQGQLDLLAGRVATPVKPAGARPDGRAIAPGARVAPDARHGRGDRRGHLEPGARWARRCSAATPSVGA
jgi:mannose-1-phosphate guanylyltransferase